ncbi:topology modulation protein [Lentibacillus saliphilus]|uniref:topology modulation protein n=1 Tax=Lentibacillus saliphilus TaxID=2737028 RepID=UPI001C2F9EF5|nr:topology modulation protein [Lentibacillus saliphilus]
MKKIMVIGVSAGAGKSTFAMKLGEKLGIHVYHLDALFWKPGWVQTMDEEFAEAQTHIIKNEQKWIIEGNYSSTYSIREEQADTIIYLELPLWLCLYRVVKRFITYRGQTRPDMAVGCSEKLDWTFIKFIVTTYRRRKKNMAERCVAFEKMGNERRAYRLKGRKEVQEFIQTIDGLIE